MYIYKHIRKRKMRCNIKRKRGKKGVKSRGGARSRALYPAPREKERERESLRSRGDTVAASTRHYVAATTNLYKRKRTTSAKANPHTVLAVYITQHNTVNSESFALKE